MLDIGNGAGHGGRGKERKHHGKRGDELDDDCHDDTSISNCWKIVQHPTSSCVWVGGGGRSIIYWVDGIRPTPAPQQRTSVAEGEMGDAEKFAMAGTCSR